MGSEPHTLVYNYVAKIQAFGAPLNKIQQSQNDPGAEKHREIAPACIFSFLPKDLKAHNVTKISTVSQWLTKFSQFYIFSDA